MKKKSGSYIFGAALAALGWSGEAPQYSHAISKADNQQ